MKSIEELKNTIIKGDCLEVMKGIPDGSIDAVICDPPYGTTACKWDTVIPFDPMWEQLKRVTKKNGAIVLFGSQPFTSALVMSNPKMFKYEWVWDKKMPVGHLNAKIMPLRKHENIVVFSNTKTVYNPQMTEREKPRTDNRKEKDYKDLGNQTYGAYKSVYGHYTHKYPQSIISISNADQRKLHPTQKPIVTGKQIGRAHV